MKSSEKLKKAPIVRYNELFKSLCIIRDSIDMVYNGKIHQLIPLYGQLRSLLIDNSKKNIPLLKEMASISGVELTVYYFGFNDSKIIEKKPLYEMNNIITLDQEFDSQELINIFDIIDQTVVNVSDNTYSYRELIKILAEKSGGAHYATQIEQHVAELFSSDNIKINGLSPNETFILKLSEIISNLGLKIIRKYNTLQFLFSFQLLDLKLNNECVLFDYYLPNTQLRLQIFISSELRLGITIIDLNGICQSFISDNYQIEYNKFSLAEIGFSTKDDLLNEIVIIVNNELHLSETTAIPLLIINEIQNVDFYMNRTIENENAGCNIAHGSLQIFDEILDENTRRVEIFQLVKSMGPEDKLRVFNNGSYGFRNHLDQRLDFFGNFSEVEIAKESLIRHYN